MREEVLAHKHVDAMHPGRVGKDGIHARDVAKNVTSTAIDMRLTPRQIREGFEDAKARLRKPDGKPRARGGFGFNACPDISQHLHHRLFLARASLYLDEERFAAFNALVSQHLHTLVGRKRIL